MRQDCRQKKITMPGDYDDGIPGIRVTCLHCKHSVDCYGTTARSTRRALALMRKQCPEGENNFYVIEDSQ